MTERKKSLVLPKIKGPDSNDKARSMYKRFMKVTSDPKEEDIEF